MIVEEIGEIGIIGDYFYLIEEIEDFFSLWVIDIIPESYDKISLKSFIIENQNEGSALTGSYEDIIEELNTIYQIKRVNIFMSKGYDIFQSDGSEYFIDGALIVEKIDSMNLFKNDFEACRQAEKDGVIMFINDIDGLEKGCYVDTPTNRKYCIEMIKKYPQYRIENWMNPDEEYYQLYTKVFN